MTTHKKFLSLAAVGVLALGLAACGDDDDAPEGTVAATIAATDTVAGTDAAPAATDAATDVAATVGAAGGTVPEGLGDNEQVVSMLKTQLESAGLTVTDEQASCLADEAGGMDPTDPNSAMDIFENCDIDIAALAGG